MTKFERFKERLHRIFAQGKQHWLTSKIPTQFVDVDYLIELVLFESLIQFWEFDDGDSKAADVLASTEHTTEQKKAWLTITDAYLWAKDGRESARINLNTLNAWAVRCLGDTDEVVTENALNAVKEASERFKAADSLHLMNIVIHRHMLWS